MLAECAAFRSTSTSSPPTPTSRGRRSKGSPSEPASSVEPVPILFAALLNAHGHKGPAEIPPKRVYVFKDTLRRAAVLGVPFGPPPSHPFRPLLALRAATAVPAEDRSRAVTALFAEVWGPNARGVEDEAIVAEVLGRAGLDGEALVAATRDPAVKGTLRTATEQALDRRRLRRSDPRGGRRALLGPRRPRPRRARSPGAGPAPRGHRRTLRRSARLGEAVNATRFDHTRR